MESRNMMMLVVDTSGYLSSRRYFGNSVQNNFDSVKGTKILSFFISMQRGGRKRINSLAYRTQMVNDRRKMKIFET